MKKLFSLCMICLLAVSAMAQSIAVMEFNAGAGVTQADVDGVSAIFNTYFQPAGYTIVERARIDRAIEELRFQRSSLTENQKVRIGEILHVSQIVVGDINLVLGQYNVDVRVISVSTGVRVAQSGADFAGSSYRETMKKIAQDLARQIAISAGPTVSAQSSSSSPTAKTRTKVESIYGYLYVFPNELGVFQSVPTNVIRQINNQGMHGYDEWRVPTNEELSLLRANGYLSGAQYMTKESPSGMVLLVTTGKTVAEKKVIKAEEQRQEEARKAELRNQGYVDLGLPSGTFWKDKNEGGDNKHYSYDEAKSTFGNKLPSRYQLEELKNRCSWSWTGNAYKVVGPNGNYIILPAASSSYCNGEYNNMTKNSGFYWSSNSYDSTNAILLGFYSGYIDIGTNNRCLRNSVRLVQ